jgi:acylphosphatase
VKCVHVYYSGSVQGVGFRYTAQQIALDLGVKGWVKNLWDGRVEVLAEGEESRLKDFLARLEDDFSGHIRNADVSWEPATDSFRSFSVKF